MTLVVVLYLYPIKFNISTWNEVTNVLPKTGPPRGGGRGGSNLPRAPNLKGPPV